MKTLRPEIIRFQSELLTDDGNKTYAKIPTEISVKLQDMEKLAGTINNHPFRAKISNNADEATLRVNAAMLRGSKAKIGDNVNFAVLGPESAPVISEDMQTAFEQSPGSLETWAELTELGQRDWIRWIEGAKTRETRARRIKRAVDQLEDGKRRACCVNINEFMLCQIKEDDDKLAKNR